MDQAKGQKDIQYNEPNKRTKGHTIQWTKQKDKRTYNTMDQTKGHTIQWTKQKDKRTYNTMDQTKGQKDIQCNGPSKRTKGHTMIYKTLQRKLNNCVTLTPLTYVDEHRCSGRISSSCSTYKQESS
jgi:hypothetical protein